MKIFIAGHNGLVGSAIKRRLEKEDVSLIFADRSNLDLMDQKMTDLFLTVCLRKKIMFWEVFNMKMVTINFFFKGSNGCCCV